MAHTLNFKFLTQALQNHVEDCANFLGLLRKAELYKTSMGRKAYAKTVIVCMQFSREPLDEVSCLYDQNSAHIVGSIVE